MLTKSSAKIIYLKDYQPAHYLIESIELAFDLGETFTEVRSRLTIKRNVSTTGPLILDGEALQLKQILLDGKELATNEYQVNATSLIIAKVPAEFNLEIITQLNPDKNTALSGLYRTSGNFCTQCEAEGFRRITYFPDRPDVLATYTVKITADKKTCPVLLSNGNLLEQGELDDGRHWVKWQDPFKKPSYLFALVAGDLECLSDEFTTCSGRNIALKIYVEKGNLDKCAHAMQSLQQAMRWDEEQFGREYDLDIFMIVAVSDFNMGAMENKGLNVFNDKYILAKTDTATDYDYDAIQEVIGHEYFHNWSGNRVTCRDWFQLSLKEGLTVFRDQEFSADMTSRAVKRINDANIIRTHQFAEDSGPMAHPVQPDSYLEINNFYTMTIYNKGAEVIRMMKTLLGPNKFRQAMDLYFARHDGQAVTIKEFTQAMEDAGEVDLEQFCLWYSQAGTPELTVKSDYDPAQKILALTVSQTCPATPGQTEKKAFYVPFAIGLLDAQGNELPLQLQGEAQAATERTRVLALKQVQETFSFINMPSRPIPSLLRNFSAPVKLTTDLTDADLMVLLAHDSDAFNRWDAGQQLAIRSLLAMVQAYQTQESLQVPAELLSAYRSLLLQTEVDPALKAEVLSLPSENYLAELMTEVDVEAIHAARSFLRQTLAQELKSEFLTIYHNFSQPEESALNPQATGQRKLKNLCLSYLLVLDDEAMLELAFQQYEIANNMTDSIAVVSALANKDCLQRDELLAHFYQRWQHEHLVIDKWFTVQASSELADTFAKVQALTQHKAFSIKNPNKLRALIGAFCRTPIHFHHSSGQAYEFLTDYVLQLDRLNPQIAARLVSPLIRWGRYDKSRQALMRAQLERIANTDNLSKDVYEIVAKALQE